MKEGRSLAFLQKYLQPVLLLNRLLQLLGEVDREQGARLIHGHLHGLGPVQGRLARVLKGVCDWSVIAILASD